MTPIAKKIVQWEVPALPCTGNITEQSSVQTP